MAASDTKDIAVTVNKAGKGWGFAIIGGSDTPRPSGETGFFITNVMPSGAAEAAGLQVGDQIVNVNDVNLLGWTHTAVVELLANKELPDLVPFVVRRSVAPEKADGPSLAHASTRKAKTPRDGPKLFEEIDVKAGSFGIKLSQLVELVSERGTNGVARLEDKFGGVDGLAQRLNTDFHAGIREGSIEERQSLFGKNAIPDVKPKSIWELMWEAMQDVTLIVLVIAGVISLALGLSGVEGDPETAWIEGAAIMVSVAIVVLVTAINDLQKERQFQDLQKSQESIKTASVFRRGSLARVGYSELVVGDILSIEAGAILPADGILVEGSDVRCDESSLTGEPIEVEKSEGEDPFLLSGTAVKNGTGKMIITCVGLFSEEGIINKLITGVGAEESARLEALDRDAGGAVVASAKSGAKDAGPLTEEELKERAKEAKQKKKKQTSVLQAKLTRLAIQIGYAGTIAAAATVLILMIRFFIEDFAVDGRAWDHGEDWGELLTFLIVGVTVLVVAVPEGLPLAVTISLAYSVKKMMKDNNLVRVLAACETMGNATTICSDKTGTLTMNSMSVVRAWIAGRDYEDLSGIASISKEIKETITLGCALNSDEKSEYRVEAGKPVPTQDGNKTECACLQFSDGFSPKTFKEIRADYSASSSAPTEIVKVYPFNSAKKMMSTICKLENGRYRLLVKGASEIVLKSCVSQQDEAGATVPLDEAQKNALVTDVIETYASEALRVILLAYRDFDEAMDWDEEEVLVQGLTISCFVGIRDPVREEVPDAVRTCQKAGVVVRMLTGDNMITARAIARNCGIITDKEDFIIMEGPQFRREIVKADGEVDHEKLAKIWPQLRVIGRCSPTDKYNLVKGLIHAGQVVAVTGDGTNDGPALSEADVGFAMGITGTAVAQQAADIIITDDNFTSIVKAISWGRNVYDSISKFLTFQLTVNFVAVIVAFVGAAAIKESPLRAVQLLWVNLIMDTFASLALATEQPVPELLERAPYGRHAPLINKPMFRQILGHSLYQLTVMFVLVFAGEEIFDIPNGRGLDHNADPTQHYTIVFNVFVLMTLFNEINARKIHGQLNVFEGFFTNAVFVTVILGTFAAQIIIVQFGGLAFKTKGLTGSQWGASLVFGLGSLLWNPVIHFLFPVSAVPQWLVDLGAKAAETSSDDEDEEEIDIQEGRNIGPMLWLRARQRLVTQLRVINAFRSAGQMTALEKRQRMMADRALEQGPAAGAAIHDVAVDIQPVTAPTPAQPAAQPSVGEKRVESAV